MKNGYALLLQWQKKESTLCCAFFVSSLILFGNLWAEPLHAQSDSTGERLRFGVVVGGGVSLHAAEFKDLLGLPTCCPQYHSGTGVAPTAGIFFEFPVQAGIMQGLRLLLTNADGRLTSVETKPVIIGSRLQDARIEHSLDARIQGIGIEPITTFRLLQQFGAFIGLRADVAMRGEASQKETLLLPEVGTFENDKRVRNEKSGPLFGMQPFMMSVLGGFRFSFPINKNNSILMMPELSFSVGLNPILYNQEWRVHTIKLGLGLAFQSPRLPVVSPEIVPVPPPNIAAELSTAVFDGVEENPDLPVRVDEFETQNIHPLLPIMFFEQNSDALPARYRFLTKDEATAYSRTRSPGGTALSTYYDLLNIVGSRMKQYPAEQIRLVGCTDESETERANTQLSRRRAENVSHYLQQVWGIDRKRISIEARNKPEYASGATAQRDEEAENRRVEIYASSLILAPVGVRSMRYAASPRFVRLRPASGGSDVIDRWEIKLYQSGDVIKTMNGSGGLPLKLQVDLRDDAVVLLSTDSLTAHMVLNGRSGVATSALTTIRSDAWTVARKTVEHSTDTVFISSMILFTPNSIADSVISSALPAMIRPHLQAGARISLIDHNSTTAEYARKVQSWLGISSATVFNREDSVRPFSSTFPEGRIYNNSVELYIRTTLRR